MKLEHPCGCVEYEHGNHHCRRHAAMTPHQRTRDYLNGGQNVDPRQDPERRRYMIQDYDLKRIPKPERSVGIGGAPNRAVTLPEDSTERKQYPIATGVLDYFPDAIVAIAHLSWRGNEQHNPGQEVHWARGKSSNEADTMMRHFLQRGTLDIDGVRHSTKLAWRALAALQKEIEADLEKGEAA